ncbi:hypothetical protein HY988_04785 [Candidatus Micrarchaeota archaeon]|nr:hypothetical protein [Candidatus Micrarchaeota archaeon]
MAHCEEKSSVILKKLENGSGSIIYKISSLTTSMKALVALSLIFLIFLMGCTEKEEKEFFEEIVKDSVSKTIKDLNPLKTNHTKTEQIKLCNPLYDDKFSCEYVNYEYAVSKTRCLEGNIKETTIIGPSYEYCNEYGEYTREYCDTYTLKEIKAEKYTTCLVQNTQVGIEYCRGGQIKREIIQCNSSSTCIVNNGNAECASLPPPENPLDECLRDSKGRCPSGCVEYFGKCVYPP